MNWNTVKRYLKRRNRIVEITNRNTPNEILTLWDGQCVCLFMPDQWINIMYRSGRPITIVERVIVKEAASKYDYPEVEDRPIGIELPPDKDHKKPRRVYK